MDLDTMSSASVNMSPSASVQAQDQQPPPSLPVHVQPQSESTNPSFHQPPNQASIDSTSEQQHSTPTSTFALGQPLVQPIPDHDSIQQQQPTETLTSLPIPPSDPSSAIVSPPTNLEPAQKAASSPVVNQDKQQQPTLGLDAVISNPDMVDVNLPGQQQQQPSGQAHQHDSEQIQEVDPQPTFNQATYNISPTLQPANHNAADVSALADVDATSNSIPSPTSTAAAPASVGPASVASIESVEMPDRTLDQQQNDSHPSPTSTLPHQIPSRPAPSNQDEAAVDIESKSTEPSDIQHPIQPLTSTEPSPDATIAVDNQPPVDTVSSSSFTLESASFSPQAEDDIPVTHQLISSEDVPTVPSPRPSVTDRNQEISHVPASQQPTASPPSETLSHQQLTVPLAPPPITSTVTVSSMPKVEQTLQAGQANQIMEAQPKVSDPDPVASSVNQNQVAPSSPHSLASAPVPVPIQSDPNTNGDKSGESVTQTSEAAAPPIQPSDRIDPDLKSDPVAPIAASPTTGVGSKVDDSPAQQTKSLSSPSPPTMSPAAATTAMTASSTEGENAKLPVQSVEQPSTNPDDLPSTDLSSLPPQAAPTLAPIPVPSFAAEVTTTDASLPVTSDQPASVTAFDKKPGTVLSSLQIRPQQKLTSSLTHVASTDPSLPPSAPVNANAAVDASATTSQDASATMATSPLSPTSGTREGRIALILKINKELIRLCVDMQAKNLVTDPLYRDIAIRLQGNLGYLAGIADRTSKPPGEAVGKTGLAAPPRLDVFPQTMHAPTSPLPALYDKLIGLFDHLPPRSSSSPQQPSPSDSDRRKRSRDASQDSTMMMMQEARKRVAGVENVNLPAAALSMTTTPMQLNSSSPVSGSGSDSIKITPAAAVISTPNVSVITMPQVSPGTAVSPSLVPNGSFSSPPSQQQQPISINFDSINLSLAPPVPIPNPNQPIPSNPQAQALLETFGSNALINLHALQLYSKGQSIHPWIRFIQSHISNFNTLPIQFQLQHMRNFQNAVLQFQINSTHQSS